MSVDVGGILWAIVTGIACVLAVVVLLPKPHRRRRRHLHLLSTRLNAGPQPPGSSSRSSDRTHAGSDSGQGFSQQ